MEPTYDPAILLLSVFPKESKSECYSDTCIPMFIVAQFTIAKLWNQLRCPSTDEWIKEMWYTHTMEFYSTTKNKIMSLAEKWMELENMMLSEISQSQKNEGPYVFSHMWKLGRN